MRILHILANPPNTTGGISINTKKLSKYLKKNKIYSEFLTFDNNTNKFQAKSIDGFKINYLPSKGYFFLKNMRLLIFIELYRFLKKYSKLFDIYHIHSHIYFTSLYSIIISKILKKPNILTLRGGVQKKNLSYLPLIEKIRIKINWLIYKSLGIYCINKCFALTSVSRRDLLSIGKVFFSKRKSNNFWIPNGIEINPQHFTKTFERKYITFIGRLDYLKGFDQFLDMMEEINRVYPSIPIMIVGKGPLSSLIKQKSKTLNINYIPFVPHEKIHEIYLKSKMYVMCSYSEGFPTTILEAMAYGTPVVASSIPNIQFLINDGVEGFLYEVNNKNEGIKKILTLLEDKMIWEEFSILSKKKIRDNYLIDRITKSYIQVYEKIIEIYKK